MCASFYPPLSALVQQACLITARGRGGVEVSESAGAVVGSGGREGGIWWERDVVAEEVFAKAQSPNLEAGRGESGALKGRLTHRPESMGVSRESGF